MFTSRQALVKLTVTSDSRQSAMNWMECDIVHRVNILVSVGVCVVGAMALEGEVVFGIVQMDVLYGNAAFNRSNTESDRLVTLRFVGENRQTSMLIL